MKVVLATIVDIYSRLNKDTRSIIIGVIVAAAIVISFGIILFGGSNGATDNVTDDVITYREAVYKSLSEQYLQQYSELQAQYISLQLEYSILKGIDDATKRITVSINPGSQDIVVLRAQVAQLQTELANNRVVLQEYANNAGDFESKFYNSQYEKQMMIDNIAEERLAHQDLRDRIAVVTDRTDITTSSNLTAPERVTFYTMWDLWIIAMEKDIAEKQTAGD